LSYAATTCQRDDLGLKQNLADFECLREPEPFSRSRSALRGLRGGIDRFEYFVALPGVVFDKFKFQPSESPGLPGINDD